MKIAFWLDYDQTYTFVALFKEMQKRRSDLSATGVVMNDRYFQAAQEGFPPGSELVRFYDLHTAARQRPLSEAELTHFKAFDEQHRLGRIAYGDRHLLSYSYDEEIRLLANLELEFRAYLEREKPDLFIFNCVASQYAHLMFLLLREYGIRVVIPTIFGVEDLFYMADSPYMLCPDIWESFRAYRQGSAQIDADTRAWAEGFIANIRGGNAPYRNLAGDVEQKKFALPSPMRVIRYLSNHFRYYRNDPTLPSVVGRAKKLLWLRRNRKLSFKRFSPASVLEGQKFVYFPLHFEPEISTLILSPYDQRSVIDFVARQLPLNWRLVVKDHPAMLGHRDVDYYDGLISKYPNVVVLDPGVPSSKLAREAELVLTLNGTVFIESLIFGTPIIFLSPSRFGGFDLGAFTNNLIDFGLALDQALKSRWSDEDLVAMFAAIRRHTDRMTFIEPLENPQVLAPENIAALANAIEKHLNRAQVHDV